MARNREEQFQMSDAFASFVIRYIKENKIKFSSFCKEAKINEYITKKVIDRKIKMHIYSSYIKKISNYFGSNDIPLIIKKYEK